VMAILEDKETALRRLAVPAVAGVLAAAAGLFLTRREKAGRSMPNMPDLGIGDLADDLRRKLDAVLNKTNPSGGDGPSDSRPTRHIDPDELAQRRRERQQRRSRRHRKS
jgi:hypothetical protein